MKNPAFQVLATMILGALIVVITFVYMRGTNSVQVFSTANKRQESVEAKAIRSSKVEYQKAKDSSADFAQSQCLSEDMGNGYALDVVHDPRTVEDQIATCSQNQSGKLVEILPDGTIYNIRN